MRHLKSRTKLNMTASHRKAVFRNLANALFEHERIKTTNPKAMALRRVADRLISLAKRNDMHAMRRAFAFLRNKEMVKKLFSDIGARYTEISGGYTRVLKAGFRKGDAAPMAIIELTQRKEKEAEKKGEDKGKAKAKKAKAKEAKSKEAKPKEAKAKEKKTKESEEKKEAKPKTKKAKAEKPEAAEKQKATKPRAKKPKETEPGDSKA
jgi:large subunit ribosomal protein L17